MDYNEYMSVTLIDEEGTETEFDVLGTIENEGNTYVALAPTESEENEYVILKVAYDEDGNENFVTIDDDDEFDAAAQLFNDEFMDESDLDDAYDEDDEDEEDGE